MDDNERSKYRKYLTVGHPNDTNLLFLPFQLLGINIFTYILAGLILFFFSMNLALGPGWLGQVVGIEGTGSIKEVSDALPDNVDLTSPEFKLDL